MNQATNRDNAQAVRTPAVRAAAVRSQAGQRPRRKGKQWSGADVARLLVMAERELSVDRIARKLGRTESAVRAEATRQRIKLAPTEKPRYGAVRRPGDAGQPPRRRRRAPKPQTAAGQDRVARDPELTQRLF